MSESPTSYRARALDSLELLGGIPTENRLRLTEMVDADPTAASAMFTVIASDPAYRTAFESLLPDPQRGHLVWNPEQREAFAQVEQMRTAMSLTAATGGVPVPYTLDPSVIFSSAGSVSPFRRIARVEQTASDTANFIVSDGLASEWLPEATEAADGSFTFVKKTVTPAKLASYVVASYEILQDSNEDGALHAAY